MSFWYPLLEPHQTTYQLNEDALVRNVSRVIYLINYIVFIILIIVVTMLLLWCDILKLPLRGWEQLVFGVASCLWSVSEKLSSSNKYSQYRHIKPDGLVAPKSSQASLTCSQEKLVKLMIKIWLIRE
jgi:hypothetical protein